MSAKVGCNVDGVYTNILAYADDVVLLAPSWGGALFAFVCVMCVLCF